MRHLIHIHRVSILLSGQSDSEPLVGRLEYLGPNGEYSNI